jgi:predicted nucleic-acid-binding protein
MIGLDTNILVRLVVADDTRQVEQAQRFLGKYCTQDDPAFINLVVLCELAWALERNYGLDRDVIHSAISSIIANPLFVVEKHEIVQTTLNQFRANTAEFADQLIGEINRSNGCDTTATFDRKAAKLEGFTLVR